MNILKNGNKAIVMFTSYKEECMCTPHEYKI